MGNKKGFCDGKQQSPIDINEQRDLQLHVSNQLKLNWKMWRPTADQYVDVINTGRTIQIQGKGLEISTTEFEHKNYKLQISAFTNHLSTRSMAKTTPWRCDLFTKPQMAATSSWPCL